MASGKIHALGTVICGGVISPALVLVGDVSLGYAMAYAGGCLVGLVMSPDLDLPGFTYADTVVRRSAGRLGWVLSVTWFVLWWPYSQLIPHHRHPLSHMPVLGTALRMIYLGLFALIIYGLLSLIFEMPALSMPGPFFWWAAAGLATVDALHYLMDVVGFFKYIK